MLNRQSIKDIPGFCYDPDLKRYFKRPNGGTVTPGASNIMKREILREKTSIKAQYHDHIVNYIRKRTNQFECNEQTYM